MDLFLPRTTDHFADSGIFPVLNIAGMTNSCMDSIQQRSNSLQNTYNNVQYTVSFILGNLFPDNSEHSLACKTSFIFPKTYDNWTTVQVNIASLTNFQVCSITVKSDGSILNLRNSGNKDYPKVVMTRVGTSNYFCQN